MSTPNPALSFVNSEVKRQHPYQVTIPSGIITVKLNQNEIPFDLPSELKQKIFDSWQQIAFNRYPPEQPDDLVRLIAEHIGWSERGIIVGNGSNELTYSIGLTFVSAGARVVLPRPMFSFYEKVVNIFGGEVVPIPPCENLGFNIDGILEAIKRTMPSVVVLTSPNNPTSLVVSLEDLQSISKATLGLVLIDEAYIEFAQQPSMLSVLSEFPNIILLRTFSKAYGLAGLRVGYLIGDPDLMSEIMKIRPPFMIDPFSCSAIKLLLSHSDIIQERIEYIQSETKHLIRALKKIDGIHVLEGQSNFVTFRPPDGHQEIFQKLARLGILVRDMSGYAELNGYLRVSTGTSAENTEFINALTTLLQKDSN